jgi:hypothetical protein
MNKKLPVLPTITAVILGLVWLTMTLKGMPVPGALTQALVASVGAVASTGILKGAVKNET